METQMTNNTRLLFNEKIRLTEITEFGLDWIELTSGRAVPPPQGARFDLAFEGSLEGPDIAGTIKGVDYLEVRADGRFMMNIYATIITEDGELIAMHEDGVVTPTGNGTARLQLNMKLTASSPKYAWLNTMQVWGIGSVDIGRGSVSVSAFTGGFYKIPTQPQPQP